MAPFLMRKNVILNGDCLELFKDIPDCSIDMTFADPPFNLKKKYANTKDSLEVKEYLEWCKQLILEMVRVTKPTGSIFVHNIPKWLTYYSTFLNEAAYFRHWIAWDAMTSPMGKSLQPSLYGILYYTRNSPTHELPPKFHEIRYPHKTCRKCNSLLKDYGGKKSKIHPFGPLVSDVWTDIHRVKHAKYRDKHPCQLPIHLMERMILMSTDEGDIVLDPFSGTGCTLIAAKKMGRKYIGFEKAEEYVEISIEKLDNTDECKIDGAYVSMFLDKIYTLRDMDWDKVANTYSLEDDLKDVYIDAATKKIKQQETV